MSNAGRLTREERDAIELQITRLEGGLWPSDPFKVRWLKRRLERDDEAQARDGKKGRWKRSR
ncbi:MAG: hypothetical protein Q7S28_00200 [bacterium]|nr:hypothetical protein [bacterium]